MASLDFPNESDPEQAQLANPAVQKILTCPICMNTMKAPRRACQNDHNFCGKCIQEWYESKGGFNVHCPQCRGHVVVSETDGVTTVGVHAHLLCDLIETQACACPLGCKEVFKLKELREHKKKCPKMVVSCPFAPLGCDHEATRDLMETHIKNYNAEHLILIANKQMTTHNMIIDQNKLIQNTAQSVQALNTSVAEQRASLEAAILKMNRNQVIIEQLLGQIPDVMKANVESFAKAVNSSRAPKRKAAALKDAADDAKEMCSSFLKALGGKEAAPSGRRVILDDDDSDEEFFIPASSYAPTSPSYSPTSPTRPHPLGS